MKNNCLSFYLDININLIPTTLKNRKFIGSDIFSNFTRCI